MKLKSVKAYKLPTYPRERDFLPDSPQTMPFMSKKALIMAITALTMNLNINAENGEKAKQTIQISGDKDNNDSINLKQNSVPKYECAPIFEHGEGRGAIGCRIMTSPVFISEEEARSIIAEMLAEQNVKITSYDKTFENLVVPLKELKCDYEILNPEIESIEPDKTYKSGDFKKNYTLLDVKKPIKIDVFSESQNIGVIFVSYDDFMAFKGPGYVEYDKETNEVLSVTYTTVDIFDTKRIAKELAPIISNYGKFTCGIIYDPIFSSRQKHDKPQYDYDQMVISYYDVEKQLSSYTEKLDAEIRELKTKFSVTAEMIEPKDEKQKIDYLKQLDMINTKYMQQTKELEIEANGLRKLLSDHTSDYINDVRAQVSDFIVWLKEKKIID